MEKAFVSGSGMYHTIHCLGSKFIFLMTYFLSNIKRSVYSLPARWLPGVGVGVRRSTANDGKKRSQKVGQFAQAQ